MKGQNAMRSAKVCLLLCCLVALGAADVAWGQDYVIPETNTPPEIDGLNDDAVWATAAVRDFSEFFLVDTAGGDLDGPDDLSAFWQAAWDDTFLYFYAEVTDDEIVNDDSCDWNDDSIEVYIDAQNLDVPDYNPANVPGIPAYQFTAIAGNNIDEACGSRIPEDSTSVFTYGINSYNEADDIAQYPQGSDISASVVKDDNHYTLEVAFPWEALEETPANIIARGEMGFGVAVNDDDDFGDRDNQVMWATTNADLWNRSESFPSVSLTDNLYVAGPGTIGTRTEESTQENPVYGPPTDEGPGLYQEWYQATNPGNKDAVDAVFESQDPMVPPFRAENGATWWTGSQAPIGELVSYPDEVQPPFNNTDNNDYTVRLTGEILIPEPGTYRFADGVDDFCYVAIDFDKSGIAGDSPEEVLINDNTWTNPDRSANGGGGGWAEVDIDVAAEGEWLAIEFNMAEGGGGDHGILHWDYDPGAPEGQRLGGQENFPEDVADPIWDPVDAETVTFVPDTHLRSSIRELISADLVAEVSKTRTIVFDVNGDTDEADQIVVENPDANIYTTILDVDGATFQIAAVGALANGDTFDIIDADQILGVPSILPEDTWTFDPITGQITLGAVITRGDYNGNGQLDAGDLDLQAEQIVVEPGDPAFDLNGDNVVDFGDRQVWINDLAVTWMGDANLNCVFDSSDQVQKFVQGKYEKDVVAGWADGDSNGDMRFNSSDMVADFVAGGYELAAKPGCTLEPPVNAAVSAVPEPNSLLLAVLGVLSLIGLARRC
jgi:hypothetical protein